MVEKYLKIINHFGVKNQCKKLKEEMKEMIDAVNDIEKVFDKCGLDDTDFFEDLNAKRKHLTEEIGDVLTVMTQFIFFYQVGKEELDRVMDYKLNRTLERIESGYYDKN